MRVRDGTERSLAGWRLGAAHEVAGVQALSSVGCVTGAAHVRVRDGADPNAFVAEQIFTITIMIIVETLFVQLPWL